jgi:hypothetical protein
VSRVRLDATPLGRPIYEKLGFTAEYELARFGGVPPIQAPATNGKAAVASTIVPRSIEEMQRFPSDVFRLDREVTGTKRENFLSKILIERSKEIRVVEREGKVSGYITTRPGSGATMIGPCIASAEAGPALLEDALRRHAGEAVLIDIPISNVLATVSAERWGLTAQRTLLRMGRGKPVHEKIDWLWASSGPEKG